MPQLEPCRVSGSATLDGNQREIDIGGVRSHGLALDGRDSLRLFAAWFPAGHEIALVSARPRGAKGHDRDSVDVVARGEEHPLVIDPRLSTTYDDAGAPRRVGLELWLGDEEDGRPLAAPRGGHRDRLARRRRRPQRLRLRVRQPRRDRRRDLRAGCARPSGGGASVLAAEPVPAVQLEALRRELHAALLREPRQHGVERLVLPTPASNASSPRKPAAMRSASRRFSPNVGKTLTRNSLLGIACPTSSEACQAASIERSCSSRSATALE